MLTSSPQAICTVCTKPFLRLNSMQVVCGVSCARRVPVMARKAKADAARAERAADKAKREALKPRSKWLQEAQAAFNAFVRLRDAGLPCISCGRFHNGSWDAGHYRSSGSCPELRFDEANCHRQCVPCNQHLHGNLSPYRAHPIARVGLAVVERLEGPNPPRRYTADDLREIRDRYRAKARALKAAAETGVTA